MEKIILERECLEFFWQNVGFSRINFFWHLYMLQNATFGLMKLVGHFDPRVLLMGRPTQMRMLTFLGLC